MLAATQEHGPFVMDDGATTFKENPYSWNKFANVVYLESPAGVGYSYAPEDQLNFNDDTSAIDNLTAVIAFFDKFPELKTNDFFIAGESYAGIYVPYLARQVLLHNKAEQDKQINLKGIMVGNGVTDWKYDTSPALLKMAFWHGLISLDLYKDLEKNNCFDYDTLQNMVNNGFQDACYGLISQYERELGGINIYDVYRKCYHDASSREGLVEIDGDLRTYKRGYTKHEYSPWVTPLHHLLKLHGTEEQREAYGIIPPCVDGLNISDYLNRKDVREALHVKT
jgi:cathepsin A (carboxypeptidase C)